MSFFDETKPYWGNTTHPYVDPENGRLSFRSVKIFADGKVDLLPFVELFITSGSGALRTGGAAVNALISINCTCHWSLCHLSFMDHITINPPQVVLCGSTLLYSLTSFRAFYAMVGKWCVIQSIQNRSEFDIWYRMFTPLVIKQTRSWLTLLRCLWRGLMLQRFVHVWNMLKWWPKGIGNG